MKLNKRLAVSLLTACMLTSSFAPAVLAADNGESGAPVSTLSDPIGGILILSVLRGKALFPMAR